MRTPLTSRRRWALALAFLTLGGIACLWPASQDARGASSPTLRYVTETLDPFPPGTSSLSALCPKRTDVIGGGVGGGSFGADPAETDIEVRATGPERLPDDPDPTTDDGWFGAVSNKDDPSAVLFVDAICARGAGLDYRDRFKSVPAESQATRRVRCPQGTNVTGGGVVDNVGVLADSDFPMEVAASAPFDGNDGDSRPDDGWFVRVTNGETETRNVIAHAVCARRGSYRCRPARYQPVQASAVPAGHPRRRGRGRHYGRGS